MINLELANKELVGNTFVTRIYYFDETDSTNNFAKNAGEDDNIIVISEFQRSGKGRYEREWESEKGSNLTFSIKKKFDIKPSEISFINFYFSYFVYETIKEYLEERNISSSQLNIKWPNDILYDSKKICGLLIESNMGKNEFIIGIGINLNQRSFSAGLNAESLYNITGSRVDVTAFLVRLIGKINDNLPMLSPVNECLFEKWKNSTELIGKSVVFNVNDKLNKFGNVIDLQRDGGIRLLISGEEMVYYSGEIKITLIGN